jgi:hypothetical protein
MTTTSVAQLVDVEMTDTAWVPLGDMTFEQWTAAGTQLQRMGRAVNFWLGDWILYGEHKFGEMYAQAIDLTGLEHDTLKNVVYVARNVDKSRRRDELSWSHHYEVASLPPAQQDEWLTAAEREGMTRNRLRARLAGTGPDAPDPDGQLAATHMGSIRFKLTADSDDAAHQVVKDLAAVLERRGVQVCHKTAKAL